LNDSSFEEITGNLGLSHLKKSQTAPGSAGGSESATAAKASTNGEANGGGVLRESGADDEGATLDAGSNVSNDSMRELEELLTKLNPLAKEFIPPSHFDASSVALAASIPKQNSRRVIDAYPFSYGCSRLLHDF
jgi:hypothetical protein